MGSYGSLQETSPLLPAKDPEEDQTKIKSSSSTPCMSANSRASRMVALLLMSLVGFGAFFCFDNPGALQKEIKTTLNITTSQFSTLYSFYSWPNVILPVLGGFLIDKVLGVRMGTILFSVFIFAGQLVLSMGGAVHSLPIMDCGRFIFGVGGESLNMALNTYTVRWFSGNELNLVFGVQLSIARLGSTVNFMVMQPLYRALSTVTLPEQVVGVSLLLAASFTLLSFMCSILLAWLDKRREKVLDLDADQIDDEPVRLSDILRLPVSFWLLCLATLSYYGSIFPFVSLAQGFFTSKFSMEETEANFVTGLVYLVSALASPLFGFLIDKTGKAVSWVMTAITMSLLSHLMLAMSTSSPYPAIILLGLAYSILSSALWSLPAAMVRQNQIATAFGLMQALQNLGTALITMGAGTIVDSYGYFWLEIFFMFWLAVGLLSAVTIWLLDLARGGHLNEGKNKPANKVEIDIPTNNNQDDFSYQQI